MQKFSDSVMYKKGQIGERIMDELIAKRDKFMPYMPMLEGGHPFDRILASKDKKQLQILEVKTIDARKFYPDTGISIAHYNDYLHIQEEYGLDVFIAFVDASLKEIYGGLINTLSKSSTITHKGKAIQYPLIVDNFTAIGKQIIYFPLAHMTRNIYRLTDAQCEELTTHSNHGYKQDVTHKRGFAQWKESHKD